MLAGMRGEAETAIAQAQIALADLPEDDALYRGSVALTLGHTYRQLGQMRDADAAFAEATQLSLAAGNLQTATIALGGRALALTERGLLREAADLLRRVIALAEEAGGAARGLAGEAYTGLGDILYEQDDLVATRLALEKALALGRQWDKSEVQADAYLR